MKIFKLRKLLTLMAVALVASAAIIPTKASAAWKQADLGVWIYTEGDTSVSGWKSIDGKWYFFDSNGIMKTGWVLDGTTWYYLASSGDMKTGWVLDNNTWYYLDASGAMKTGLVDVNGKTYCLSESGAMKTGNVTVNGVNYSFAASGEKINPSTTTNTNTTNTTTTTTSSTTSSSSGSSGGGSSSSSSSSDSDTDSSYYESLYGTWTVGDYIPSKIDLELSETYINAAVGQELTIKSNSIVTSYGTLSNPSISEGTMTSAQFKSKYGDTFENVGISGDPVKYVRITKSGYTVLILIDEDDNVYALLKGALFHLEK